jgi:hypothetical protein
LEAFTQALDRYNKFKENKNQAQDIVNEQRQAG